MKNFVIFCLALAVVLFGFTAVNAGEETLTVKKTSKDCIVRVSAEFSDGSGVTVPVQLPGCYKTWDKGICEEVTVVPGSWTVAGDGLYFKIEGSKRWWKAYGPLAIKRPSCMKVRYFYLEYEYGTGCYKTPCFVFADGLAIDPKELPKR